MTGPDQLRSRLVEEIREIEALITDIEEEQRSLADHLADLRMLLTQLHEASAQLGPEA
jgi:hypothetical protein